MVRSLFIALFGVIFLVPHAVADVRSMGADYRTLLSNYHMLLAVRQRCPQMELPAVEPRPKVEQMFQVKVGTELYVKLMVQIQKSSLRKDAEDTITKLWEKIEGCDDPRLAQALDRIANVHAEAFARLKQEPPLVAPKQVPVPMRQPGT